MTMTIDNNNLKNSMPINTHHHYHRHRHRHCRSGAAGFTLIEFLIYIAILTIMLMGMGGIAWNVMGGGVQVSSLEEVSSNSRIVLNRITQAAREARSINSPLPGAAATTTLSLRMVDPQRDPTIFSISGNTLTIKEGGAETTAITSIDVRATDLRFQNVSYIAAEGTPPIPGTILVNFTLSHYNPAGLVAFNVVRSFQTTINLLAK